MLNRLGLAPLLRRLRRYDSGFQALVVEAERLKRQIEESEGQRTALETQLARAERQLSDMAACVAAWPAKVLDDDFIAARISPSRKHAWLVAAPKSGSTWLTNMLRQLLGWQPTSLVATWDRREQEIDLRRMLEFPDIDLFSIQQHCRFSGPTRDFIKKFHVQVILQGRNLWDSVVSLRDHFLRESTITPVCYVDRTFLEQPLDRQLDLVIDLAVPWFLNFYASWLTARQAGEVAFCWIDYESLCFDAAGQLRRILDYLGVARSDEKVDEAIGKAIGAVTRLNVGRVGRGAEVLSQAQKGRIAQLRSYYPKVDFSLVGLD
jgi:hypothetical protein